MSLPPASAADRLATVQGAISRAAADARRSAAGVTLIAVSKTKEAPAILPLIAAGQQHFGENRVQEAAAKWPDLREANAGLTLHMIGQLQSNKAEDAVRLFDVIHTLDRPSLLTALARAMDKLDRRLPCFVQVDLAGEPQKGGCPVPGLTGLLASARNADIAVAGLMAVPPLGLEPAPWFALLAKLADDNGLTGLSMGMSGDYPTAVRIGATHIRVGTALFGERS
jgi:PLP dependent protein